MRSAIVGVVGVWLIYGLGAGEAWSKAAPTPLEISAGFKAPKSTVREEAARAFGKGCTQRGRGRFAFRRLKGGLSKFKRLLKDSTPAVRLAALTMVRCFRREEILSPVGALVFDGDRAVSLEAMTMLAHTEDKGGVAPLVKWLKDHQATCMAVKPAGAEHCIFAVYALGQCAQHEEAATEARALAAAGVAPFLEGATPKLRKVASVALGLVGGAAHRPLLERLIKAERSGAFSEGNPGSVIEELEGVLHRLR